MRRKRGGQSADCFPDESRMPTVSTILLASWTRLVIGGTLASLVRLISLHPSFFYSCLDSAGTLFKSAKPPEPLCETGRQLHD